MSQEQRPILFLDIDGVISLFGVKGELAAARELRVEVPLGRRDGRLDDVPVLIFDGKPHPLPDVVILEVFLDERIEEHLGRLVEAYEVIWCSAGWQGRSNRLLEAMESDLGPFECLPIKDSKIEAIIKRAEGRRWAFVDDEIAHELSKVDEPPNGLLIKTDPGVGITEAHVEELLSFAATSTVA